MYQNHVIDPTFFYDAIEQFAFDYSLYVVTNKTLNDAGNTQYSYNKQTIRGSLQSNGKVWSQSKDGNVNQRGYDFYCKSLYRIDVEDVLEYKGNFFVVDSVHDYDEYGVRSCTLKMIQLTAYRDLRDYIKYLEGEVLV